MRPLEERASDAPATPARETEPRSGFVAVGRVLGAWGVQGALKVEPLSDFPDRFAAGARLWLRGVERRVTRSHLHRGAVIAKLEGIDEPDAGRGLRGALLEVPEAELHPLTEDEYYQHDLVGLTVMEANGEELGRVTGLLPTGANAVLIVRGPRGEYLLPLIAEVVQEIDLQQGRMTVALLPGLEPSPPRAPAARGGRRTSRNASP
jgi:16S rRNA processing protein RimM